MRCLPRYSMAVWSVLMLLVGAAPAAGVQLGGRPAAEWVVSLESGQRLARIEVDRVVSMIGMQPGDVVADIGAGTGVFTVLMAKEVGPTGTVVPVEIDEGFMPIIMDKAREAGVENVAFVLGEFDDPKLPRRDIDIAFFHDVLHHVEHRQEYLRALAGYLAPGGRIVVVDYDMNVPGVPHFGDATMTISAEMVDGWMRNAGLTLNQKYEVFPDRFYLIYKKN
ncbi:MAG: class I SAM-dependent methyltransferase [Gemmatimonadetes bacterium]|nr:class I SAM-dependent methyltransferase [Gemmatimonadota bacterium]